MEDERRPRKRRRSRRDKGRNLPTDHADDLAKLGDADLVPLLLGTRLARKPREWPTWLKVIGWVFLVASVIVFPVGLCVLCSWILWRFPPAAIEHRLRGVRVVGTVIASQETWAGSDDRCHRAIVEYTFKGFPFTTSDGPQMRHWPWRKGETVLLYHIPWAGEPGRHVRPGALFLYAIFFVLLNVAVFAAGVIAAMALWTRFAGGGAP
jgi:hypothetical protein